MKQLCRDCKFLIQAEGCMCCGHRDANITEKGNGRYVYPPMDWECDIGKFEDGHTTSLAEWQIQMKEVADQNGWELVSTETGLSKYRRKK